MTQSHTSAPVVGIKNLTKRFGKVIANSEINLDIHAGRIKALLGENGAGKSTLMSMLSGRYKPDGGHIEISGERVNFTSSKDGLNAGIGMVYQHFMLVETMTVAQNVLLGQEGSFIVNPKEMEKRVGDLAEKYQLEIDPSIRVSELSMGEKQRVEILKLLYRNSRVLIFDEPTAVLTPEEADSLFEALRHMASQGKAIVFISHKLDEVLSVADEIAILRLGKIEEEVEASTVSSKAELASLMVGKEVILEVDKEPAEIGEPILEVKNLTGMGLSDVNLEVKQGEIVAIVGVAGNGQKELVEAICGLRTPPKDTIFILDQPWRKFYSKYKWKKSLSYIPEDRLGLASCRNLDLVDNLLLTTRPGFVKGPWLDKKKADRKTEDIVKKHDIRPGRIRALAWQLSGGNLQKAVLARELFREPRFIVAEQPTQGLDVSAIEEVWKRLLDARKMSGILLITGDLNEAFQLADRVIVMYSGKVMDTFTLDEKNKVDNIGLLMAGVPLEEGSEE
ncbi:MAG: ABC transporter ATP-binding protein [Desulfovibrio sp.]